MACAADVTSAGSPVMARRGSWSWLLPLGIFGVALALRIAWLQGAVLGDDPLEFGFIDDVARRGTDFTGELAYRFPIWIANVVSIRLLGMSEASFFAWLAFYAKVWALYAVPALLAYFIGRGVRARTWPALGAFVGISGALHVVAAVFWKLRAGVWFPFLVWYPPPHPVPASELRYV